MSPDRHYTKPPLTIEDQLQQLEQRGMVTSDRAQAAHYLQHISYYRLTGYWLPFESDHATHTFKAGTDFSAVLNLYVFDRELRLLLLDAIERVEVSVRTQWAYQLSHRHQSAHAYLERNLATREDWFRKSLNGLTHELERSEEPFIHHYRDTYTSPSSPPIWVVCEVMSLGLLSRWITQLRPSDRGAIAKTYGLDQRVFQAFIRHLTYIRNLCAHHSRVWNRRLTVTMELPRSKPGSLVADFNNRDDRRLYNTLVMLAYLMDLISPDHHWKQRLKELIEKHAIEGKAMGFPVGFEQLGIWRSTWSADNG